MKAVLALLLTFIFLESQALALSGGPVYPVSTNIVGEYTGVMLPTSDVVTGGNIVSGTTVITSGTAAAVVGSNAIGLFDLSVPATGLAIGDFLFFSQGRVFTGTIDAFADPDSATIQGVLQATYNYNLVILSSGSSFAVSATADGGITATVSADPNAAGQTQSTTSSATNGAVQPAFIIEGTANLNVSGGFIQADGSPDVNEVIELNVTGVQQSPTPGVTTTFTQNTTTPGG